MKLLNSYNVYIKDHLSLNNLLSLSLEYSYVITPILKLYQLGKQLKYSYFNKIGTIKKNVYGKKLTLFLQP